MNRKKPSTLFHSYRKENQSQVPGSFQPELFFHAEQMSLECTHEGSLKVQSEAHLFADQTLKQNYGCLFV